MGNDKYTYTLRGRLFDELKRFIEEGKDIKLELDKIGERVEIKVMDNTLGIEILRLKSE